MTPDQHTRLQVDGADGRSTAVCPRADEREFLISIKEGQPAWGKLNIPGIELLPGIQWKLANIGRMEKKKQAEMLEKLKRSLGY